MTGTVKIIDSINAIPVYLVDTAGAAYSASGGGGSGGLTDTELRATAVPVSVSGVATAAAQATAQTSLTAIAASVAAATPAGELHIGEVGGHADIIDVTLTLDTSAYASGDLLADTQVVTNALRKTDGTGILHSLMVIDQDDQGVALDVYFLSDNQTFGSENSAPSISDANALTILCRIPVATTDYYDLGGVKVADLSNLSRIIKAVSGTRNIYVAVVNGTGTPTFTASGIKLRVGIAQD